ncbi:mechanosensitive ion channel family protein [Ruegeria sp. ANG-R]|uniref:mechanosensitive ion channel family protein n=1 Tax=Ruegeria sp. ANG-R TaxID=1577903 RepID=UPI00068F9F6F|nr:mechanosensitive ion channel family protein [Ruegeria sp. ANG-R]
MNLADLVSKTLEQWENALITFAPNLVLGVLTFAAFFILASLSRRISRRFFGRRSTPRKRLASIASTVVYIGILLFGTFLAINALGLEDTLTKLLASAGVVGIVIGFAVKDLTANSFAGLLLNTQSPFRIGDWVEIDGTFGTVERIGAITTEVKMMSGQLVFIPNQVIYTGSFKNYSTYGKRRVTLKSGVSYGDDLHKVRKVTLDEIQKIESVLRDEKIDFYFTGIGSSTFNFEVRFWIKFTRETDYLTAMNDAVVGIHDRFEAESISLAYNVTTLDFGVKGGVNLFDQAIQISDRQHADHSTKDIAK